MVSEWNPAAPSSASSSSFTEFVDMPSHPPPSTNATPRSDSTNSRRESPVNLSSSNSHNFNGGLRTNSYNKFNNGGGDFGSLRLSMRSGGPPSMELLSRLSSLHDPQLLSIDRRDCVKINDIVGNGICGILYKWVNYSKGWRPQWFVLQDGVLSYYKIHGLDMIVVTQETKKGSKIIGDESLRRISRRKNGQSQLRQKPFDMVDPQEQIG
ncbi:oxysterol-binding protein-related protein 1C-like [Macadamia integrifolia]|uniref:oxysterol-binding protein-related protein 1C-like n=1 Tax=Macadamia integrifolia TaxID=60698 RepID=UPI001C4E91A7|nr:oxysterol-binding protein-related protein 1C-like [Macadamia integrifolia]